MTIISKDDNLAWGCYLVLGVLAFTIIPGAVGYVLLRNIPAYAAVPLSTIGAVVTLFAFKKYLSWYAEDSESLSFRGKMRMMGIGWAVSVVNFLAIIVCLFLCGYYRIVTIEFDIASQLSWLSFFLLVCVMEEVIFRGISRRPYNVVFALWTGTFGKPRSHAVGSVGHSPSLGLAFRNGLRLPPNDMGAHRHALGMELS